MKFFDFFDFFVNPSKRVRHLLNASYKKKMIILLVF